MRISTLLAAAALAALLAPAPSASALLPLPVLPQWVDEEQHANVTAPCCQWAWARVNATDPDDSSFYDSAEARAAGNGSLPANVTARLFAPIPRVTIPLPHAAWWAGANVSGHDSHVSDSFDHLSADWYVGVRFNDSYWAEGGSVSCTDGTPIVPGPESCA